MATTTVYDCNVIELNIISNNSSNITFVESNGIIPFHLKRIYYTYDIPGGEHRGGHAHKELHQLIVAASGSFEVLLDDGINKKVVRLNRPNYGLLVKPGLWRELSEFSSGTICLVMTSHKYDPADYIRDYNKFIKWKSLKRTFNDTPNF